MGRNTAPAIALAALMVETPAAPLLVMPSDHVIIDLPAFYEAIDRALPLVREGWLVTFGVTPETPETGYGYIKMAERSEEHTSELQSLMRISYAVFCLKKKHNKHSRNS